MKSFLSMLTRRTVLKGLGVLGLGVSLPFTIRTSNAASDLIDAVASTPSSGGNQQDLIAAIEAREDVQDDVDVIELASRYTELVKMPDDSTEDIVLFDGRHGPCPLCRSAGYSLRVDSRGFNCAHCQQSGMGDKYFALVENISLGESVKRLQHLLDRKELTGNQCLAMINGHHEAVMNNFHRELMDASASHPAWVWLTAQGITKETVSRLRIGCWGEDILIPIRDEKERILVCVTPNPHELLVGPIGDCWSDMNCAMQRISYHRWSRLIFHLDGSKPEAVPDDTVLLTTHVWDAIRVWQAGFAPVVAPIDKHGWCIRKVRSAVKHGCHLIYVAPLREVYSSDFSNLLNYVVTRDARLDVAVLPEGLTAGDFIQTHGAGAFADLLRNAVPAAHLLLQG